MTENSRQSQLHRFYCETRAGALERRSGSERLADGIESFTGSVPFVLVHLAACGESVPCRPTVWPHTLDRCTS